MPGSSRTAPNVESIPQIATRMCRSTRPRLYGIKRPRPLRELVTASANASFGYVRVNVFPDGPFELRLALHGPENIRVWRNARQVVGRCVRDSTALRMALKFRDTVCKAYRLNLT